MALADLGAGASGLDQADIQPVADLSETGEHCSGIVGPAALRSPRQRSHYGRGMSGTVTLEFLTSQQARILDELANMRADYAVLRAIVQKMDLNTDCSSRNDEAGRTGFWPPFGQRQ